MAESRPTFSEAASRFLSSMTMTFDMWHDGIGYDLAALKGLPQHELEAVELILINHAPRDWRDIEALAAIGSPRAKREIETALKSSDIHVRQQAQLYAPERIDPADREARLIRSLRGDGLFGGLTQAIDEVPDFHPPAVVDALFRGALDRDGEAAVHFAALLMFLHGKAREPFDWELRPFFLRFNTTSREERKAVFRELCERIGVDADKYVR